MHKKIANHLLLAIVLCILIGVILNPKLSIDSAHSGLTTWFNVIVPSLLPFFIISELLTGIGFINLLSNLLDPLMKPLFNTSGASAFPLTMSIVSGYPVGARIVSSLRKEGVLSKLEAEKTLCFSSTSGPLFILGTVSIGMLNNPSFAYLIILPHYLGALTIGILVRHYKSHDARDIINHHNKDHYDSINSRNPIGSILRDSIVNSLNTITLIGGFIIFYSVLTNLFFASKAFNHILYLIVKSPHINFDREIVKGLIAGLLEVTTGCIIISKASIKIIYKIVIINFIIGWGGLSIHSQALSFIGNTDISGRLYLIAKFLHGILSSIYGLILYFFLYKSIIKPSYLPNTIIPKPYIISNWIIILFSSFKIALSVLAYLTVVALFLLALRRLIPDD